VSHWHPATPALFCEGFFRDRVWRTRLVLKGEPPDLCLLNSWDYRRDPWVWILRNSLHTQLPSKNAVFFLSIFIFLLYCNGRNTGFPLKSQESAGRGHERDSGGVGNIVNLSRA
jgi:hypothetical protein